MRPWISVVACCCCTPARLWAGQTVCHGSSSRQASNVSYWMTRSLWCCWRWSSSVIPPSFQSHCVSCVISRGLYRPGRGGGGGCARERRKTERRIRHLCLCLLCLLASGGKCATTCQWEAKPSVTQRESWSWTCDLTRVLLVQCSHENHSSGLSVLKASTVMQCKSDSPDEMPWMGRGTKTQRIICFNSGVHLCSSLFNTDWAFKLKSVR